MEIYQPYIDQIVTALIGVLATVILALIATFKAKVENWINTRQNEAERSMLKTIAEEGFSFVEQRMKEASSEEKLNAAVEYVNKQLAVSGIKFDPEAIEAAIEKAVATYNIKKKN